ncbi:MAG: hypothetical protein KC560_15405, partial [Myxococcales bacterium]|nr:hypothetical protein [Myxococcales bacterium]
GRARALRRLAFALVPALALLALAEGVARVALVASPALRSLPLPPESAGLLRPDDELFWSLAPGLDQPYMGARVATNALGLRSPPLPPGPKPEGELRILSLGESTTFGTGVENDATYTARLERELAPVGRARRVVAIDAGVPAYSSFQSLRYLETRGLALAPDVVVFYHEVNDYLPSSLRDSSNNEVGVLQTDWQRWEAERSGGVFALARASALLRFLRMRLALLRVETFDAGDFANPLEEIGLPDIGIPPRLQRVDGARPARAGLDERALGRRVSEDERARILERLLARVRERGATLALVHPAYRDSTPHACPLTRFAAAHAGELVYTEAGLALHPQGVRRGALFRDSWHPTAEGHARLARLLAADLARALPGELRATSEP